MQILANIFKAIESSAIGHEAEDDIKGLFDDIDTTNNRLGATVLERNKRLADILIGIFKQILKTLKKMIQMLWRCI